MRVAARSNPIELYDLSHDLGEKNNVASRHPEIVAKIAEIMRTAPPIPRSSRSPRGKHDLNVDHREEKHDSRCVFARATIILVGQAVSPVTASSATLWGRMKSCRPVGNRRPSNTCPNYSISSPRDVWLRLRAASVGPTPGLPAGPGRLPASESKIAKRTFAFGQAAAPSCVTPLCFQAYNKIGFAYPTSRGKHDPIQALGIPVAVPLAAADSPCISRSPH